MVENPYAMTRRGGGLPSIAAAWDDLMRRFMLPMVERTMTMGAFTPVDVCERGNEFIIRMACPGCRPEDIDVTVENDTVRIRGKYPTFDHTEQVTQAGARGEQHEACLIRELPTGSFERDIVLPIAVNAQQVRASFENGVLTLTLPKTQAVPGHKVQITTGAGTR